jgi:sugar O-acyltransferase (sialic acid O-acetyltransferase NeuD family)
MDEKQLLIVGTGAEARIAADIFTAMGHMVLGFIETDPERSLRELNDINVVGNFEEDEARSLLKDSRVEFMVAVGEMELRQKVYEKVAKRTKRPSANAVHPLSWQSSYAQLGFGNIFNAGTVVNANTVVGDMNHFHSGVTVETDVTIGNYCNINAGARIGANVVVEDQVFIGTGAVIHPGVRLGEGCLVGAGSVVLKSVDAGKRVFGNPALVV